MTQSSEQFFLKYRESLFSAVSAGFFFILVGAIFVYTTFVTDINLFQKIITFFGDFKVVEVPHTKVLLLPAPEYPTHHLAVYSAAVKFSIIWGLYQIAILTLRLVLSSPLHKKAETASNMVFWLGASYLIKMSLIETTIWFAFWAQIIMLIGASLIVRAAILAFKL